MVSYIAEMIELKNELNNQAYKHRLDIERLERYIYNQNRLIDLQAKFIKMMLEPRREGLNA